MATMTPFQRAFRVAKDAGRPDFEFPPGSGKMYTTKTAEEQGREIGARAAAGSGRGASAGRTAADRDTATTRRAEIFTKNAISPSPQEVMDRIKRLPPSKSPEQERDEAKERTMDSLGLLASVAAGPAISAAMKGARAMSGAKAAETGWRSRPPEGADPAKWQQIVKQLDEAYPGGTPFKKGGKTKAYAKGGAVRGGGIEKRGKTKGRFV